MIKRNAFTLVEMLIVIVIIGILSAALIPRILWIQARARDSAREAHMRDIISAFDLYHIDNGYLLKNSQYWEVNLWSWDYSSQWWFLTFLRDESYMKSVPVDPINNMIWDESPSNSYAYKYYCYDNNRGMYWVTLTYKKESPSRLSINVLTNTSNPLNRNYYCKE